GADVGFDDLRGPALFYHLPSSRHRARIGDCADRARLQPVGPGIAGNRRSQTTLMKISLTMISLGRRALAIFLGAFCVFLADVARCMAADSGPTPKRGGTLRLALPTDITSLDPTLAF